MQSAIPWNSYITLPPPGSRSHPGPPLQHATLTPHSGHHYPGVATSHSISAAQQQQREREERDARERERDAQARERDRENMAAAERFHRQTEIRDHAVGQRTAYYSATNTSQTAQQVYMFIEIFFFVSFINMQNNDLICSELDRNIDS